jgi:hypothetical protein
MSPNKLFNTIQVSTTEHQLDYDKIITLPDKSWSEICEILELGDRVKKSFSENEGRAITSVLVERVKRDNEIARQDQLETERDLAIAQGARI